MARIDAARRVIRNFHRRRSVSFRRNIVLGETSFGPAVVVIDTLEVSEGKMRLRGSARAKVLNFATELGFQSLILDQGNEEFDVTIEGAVQMTIRVDGELNPYPITPQTRLNSAMNVVSSALALVGVLGHFRDIWGYLVHGDSAAGDRLENLIAPPKQTATIPVAKPGLAVTVAEGCGLDEPIDIVVPVFNAFDDLQRCLDQLARHTDPRHRILLVDDASTDGRVRPFLEEWVILRQASLLILKDENRGFIEAVNAGIDSAHGHVVLLNTDAFVPEGWLERLMQPILRDQSVASVTPMSSDAEIMTAPVECVRFECETGQADALDRAAATFNADVASAELPTGVGFCMALNRTWLSQVSGFDIAFGHGYGEEVDWCRKVAELGGKHIGIGNLYVEHRGGASFGEEKQRRVQRNSRLIASRYPGYDQLVAEFRKCDPLIGPRLALAIASVRGENPLPVFIAQRMGGGSEFWLDNEIESRMVRSLGAVVVRDGTAENTVIIEVHTPIGVTRGIVPAKELAGYLSYAKRREFCYSGLVASHAPLALLNLLVELWRDSDRLTVFFHDYFPVCPSYNLMSVKGRFCDLPDLDQCQECYRSLGQTSGLRPPSISEWRAAWAGFLAKADNLVVFSQDSARIVGRVWPDLVHAIRVAPHEPAAIPRPVKTEPNAPPVMGVLGSIGYNKGAGVLRALAEQWRGRHRIVVIGKMDPSFRHKRIEVHGTYDRGAVSDLAEFYGVTHWFVPSIWPETFCFAAHECLATGLPVLAFQIGAHGDAVSSHPNGTVMPNGMSDAALGDIVSEWLSGSSSPSPR